MGFVHPVHEGMLAGLGVKLDGRGNVEANVKDYRTSLDKVFAAGDMRRGQSLVVWAIREGRQAARAVDEFLMGSSDRPRGSWRRHIAEIIGASGGRRRHLAERKQLLRR